ncbi:hypothetical protein KIN20_038114 [Parelaphostrongylus tenuis]|uniref:Uncharacterized protein n=1 Tax=Parelaphostrongylus tenuis TaxID=148309 RepID=A0AAD5RFH4_PARTN|nr:hypothetical protein KIN20_038114 [Parelaphostrongylus tenuis]
MIMHFSSEKRRRSESCNGITFVEVDLIERIFLAFYGYKDSVRKLVTDCYVRFDPAISRKRSAVIAKERQNKLRTTNVLNKILCYYNRQIKRDPTVDQKLHVGLLKTGAKLASVPKQEALIVSLLCQRVHRKD